MKADQVIPKESKEILYVVLEIESDPTGILPSWAITDVNDLSPTAWVNGTWGTYANNKVKAYTPTLPSNTSQLASTEDWGFLWLRFTVGAETPIRQVGVLNLI